MSENMNENDKINLILKEYDHLIKNMDMDVCQSRKGAWYFFRYNEEFNYYDCLIRFQTAAELVQILLGELSMDMLCLIEQTEGRIRYENLNAAEELTYDVDYKDTIDRLLVEWDAIKDHI